MQTNCRDIPYVLYSLWYIVIYPVLTRLKLHEGECHTVVQLLSFVLNG